MRYLLTILLLSLLTGCVYEPVHRHYDPYGYVNAAEPVEYYRVVQTFNGPVEVPVYYEPDPYYYDPYYYGPVVRGDVRIHLNLSNHHHHDRHRSEHRGGDHHGGWHHRK